ncbi:unnamed protein product, partial [Soboliphyme baturini]|uniref:WH2 domain-containing protein n=1 Tax=Soboliphyme baturini TaxID=241478 RepID=A0A183IAQ3_9BILA
PEDTHTKIPQPDGPPDQRPQLGPPRSLPGHRHFRPALLPGPNPNPRWRVPDPDPRGLPPNSSRAWRPPTAGRTQPLSQEPTLASGAVSCPRSGGKQHAPLRPLPLSWPLQAPNPGPEEPPESRPQVRPGPSPNPKPQPAPKPSLGAQASGRRGLLPKLSRRASPELQPTMASPPPCMPPWGHIPGRRPPGPGTRRLPILQTQALNSAFGRGHVSAGSSGRPCPVGLTLTLGCFLGLPSPGAWPGSPALGGLPIHSVGLWVPPTWKPCPLAPCRTLLAAHTYMPPLPTHTPPEDTHTKIPQPDGPPDQRPQLG